MTLKQFFRLLRQQRLFSSVYIICTALSVALAMTLFLVLYIKFGPVYPEQERARMAVVDYVAVRNVKSDQAVAGRANFQLADTHVAAVTIITYTTMLLITLLATWLPVQRASRIQPSDALRDE